MIGVNNLTAGQVDEKFLKTIAEKVLDGESAGWRAKEIELSIALVGQERIRELNKKYRGKNRVTDVLSFRDNSLGELVICPREVRKNAKRFNSAFKNELAKVLIHGILHLLGYEHEKSEKEKDKMRKKEEHYFSQIVKT